MTDRRKEILAQLERLRAEQAQLEAQLADIDVEGSRWPPVGFYTAYHVLAGMVLGMFGASMSLLFNVVGSSMVGKHPLELIRVYLTFPMGEQSLQVSNSTTLAIGCVLYLGTGMILGALIHVVLSRWFAGATFSRRFVITTAMAVGLWLFNFYGVLSWLQPALFGGNWIVRMVPWWVALTTHLVFAWTMLLIEPWGRFEASARRPEAAGA